MKIHLFCKYKWFFAVLPHECRRCNDIFWLEKGVKFTNHCGNAYRYCKECAPNEWSGARIGGDEKMTCKDNNYRYFISYVGQNGRKKSDICNAIISTQYCLDDESKIREAEEELAHYSKYKKVVFLNMQELKRKV